MPHNSPREVPLAEDARIADLLQAFVYAYHDSRTVRLATLGGFLLTVIAAAILGYAWGALGLLVLFGASLAVVPFFAALRLLDKDHL